MKVIKKYKTIITYLVSSLLSFAVDLLAFSIVLYFLKNMIYFGDFENE